MRSDLSVSIIICTCNRAASLRRTLGFLGQIRIPSGWQVEVIVVDNGSTDETAKVVRSAMFTNMRAQYLYEPKKGKSHALNLGLANARGDYVLFTDDDVRVSVDWVEEIVAPLADGRADAVVGRTELATQLQKPWLSPWMKGFLAAPDLRPGEQCELIGANMAFRRSVLQHVPAFDPELGPGALGLAEETLFGLQLAEAGLKVKLAEDAKVIHDPEGSRLTRRCWLDSVRKYGRTRGYLAYHWYHRELKCPRLMTVWFLAKLHLRRLFQSPQELDKDGCPEWEMCYMHELEMYRQFCIERRRPRNYALRGLRKLCLPGIAVDGTSRQSNPVALGST